MDILFIIIVAHGMFVIPALGYLVHYAGEFVWRVGYKRFAWIYAKQMEIEDMLLDRIERG